MIVRQADSGSKAETDKGAARAPFLTSVVISLQTI